MTNNISEEFGLNPLKIFEKWYEEARLKETSDPDAMALATADAKGRPSVRMVLLKSFDEDYFTFFTNMESEKGRDLLVNPFAEINFYWKSLGRQIRISGPVKKTSEAEADRYFSTRPRDSRIGAWASAQSQPMKSYEDFQKRISDIERQYDGKDIPRPAYWTGFHVKPERMEFWIAMPHRLHKRFVFEKKNGEWVASWLFP